MALWQVYLSGLVAGYVRHPLTADFVAVPVQAAFHTLGNAGRHFNHSASPAGGVRPKMLTLLYART